LGKKLSRLLEHESSSPQQLGLTKQIQPTRFSCAISNFGGMRDFVDLRNTALSARLICDVSHVIEVCGVGYKKTVYQFKVSLRGISPLVWRTIQVPQDYSFWDLHVALQDAMGWFDYHLHLFRIINPETDDLEEIGIPNEELFEDEHQSKGLHCHMK